MTTKTKTRSQVLSGAEVNRLLRCYLANGVRVEVNALATTISFAHPGMGKVTIEATGSGFIIHEPVDWVAKVEGG